MQTQNFYQCFQNRTGHQIGKVTGSRFTSWTDGRTDDVINIYFYILLKFKKNLINKNNKFYLNFDSICYVC